MPRYPKKTNEEKLDAKIRCEQRKLAKKKKPVLIPVLSVKPKDSKLKPLTNSMLNFLEDVWAVDSRALRPGAGNIRRQLIKRGLMESYEEEYKINETKQINKEGDTATVTRQVFKTLFRLTVEGEKLVKDRQANNKTGRINLPLEMTRDIRGEEYKALKAKQVKQKALDDEIEKIANDRRNTKTAPGKA